MLLDWMANIDGLETSCYDAPPGERMRVPSLFSRVQGVSGYRIRSASNDDWHAIEKLLVYADRQYLALEWWTVQEWLGSPTFLLITDPRKGPLGLMLTVVGDGPIAWLRAVVVASERCLAPLLHASAETVLAQGNTGLAFLGDESWILPKLKETSFRKVNQVVTLRQRGTWSLHRGPPGLEIRAATVDDVASVLTVDHAAFTPMWWYSREVLGRALNLADCFDVAYLASECVGYQLSTLRNGRGHIVRLAVHPQWQGQGIGGRLLSQAMTALEKTGASSVTVNTQEDNLTSLQLYRDFSFERIGTPWPVWFRSLVQR
jgi:ribosomal-protein-alanine N-acetyltransferase